MKKCLFLLSIPREREREDDVGSGHKRLLRNDGVITKFIYYIAYREKRSTPRGWHLSNIISMTEYFFPSSIPRERGRTI